MYWIGGEFVSASISVDGIEELIASFERMGKDVDRVANVALKEGGQVIVEEAKSILSSGGHIVTGNLKEGLSVSGVKGGKDGKYVKAGITKGDKSPIYYGKFLEWGTLKMPAYPFLAPAFESKKGEVQDTIANKIKSVVHL